eukprot:scaffold108591_cov45-Attheya_sp.AAC.1
MFLTSSSGRGPPPTWKPSFVPASGPLGGWFGARPGVTVGCSALSPDTSMAAFATSQHAAVVAITDVDVAAAALMKKVLLLLAGNWSDSEFLSNRSSISDAMSSSLYSMCSIVIGNIAACGVSYS